MDNSITDEWLEAHARERFLNLPEKLAKANAELLASNFGGLPCDAARRRLGRLKKMITGVQPTGWLAQLPGPRYPPEGSDWKAKADERKGVDPFDEDDDYFNNGDASVSEDEDKPLNKGKGREQTKGKEKADDDNDSVEDSPRDNTNNAFNLYLAGLDEMKHPFHQQSRHYKGTIHPERIRRAAERFSSDWQGLKPYQEDAVAMMLAAERGERGTSRGTMLLDEMGLGKTLEVIALMEENPVKPVLIVAPASALANWAEEFKKWLSPSPSVLMLSSESEIKDAIHKTAEDMKEYDIVLVSYTRVRTEYRDLRNWTEDMKYRRQNPYPAHPKRLIKVDRKTGDKIYRILQWERPDCPLFTVYWGRVILDEAQYMKTLRGNTHKGCCALITKLRILMTGTPLVNDYVDLHAYCKFLRIRPLNDPAWFREHFVNRTSDEVVPKEDDLLTHGNEGGRRKRSRPNEVMRLEVDRAALLASFLRSHWIRRTRSMNFMGHPLVEDLPPIQRTEVWLDLEQKPLGYIREVYSRGKAVKANQRSSPLDALHVQEFFRWASLGSQGRLAQQRSESVVAVERWAQDLLNFFPQDEAQTQYDCRLQWCELLRSRTIQLCGELPVEENAKNILTMINRARVAAVLPAAVDAKYGDEGKTGRNRKDFMSWLEENERWSSTKVRWILEHIKGKIMASSKNKIVVACHSLASLDVVAVALKMEELSFLRIDGSVAGKDRSRIRHQFQDRNSKYRILLLTTKVGGVALNLTAANILYMISPDWSAAADYRLEFRIYRLGQRQKTEVFRVFANNSADMRCKALQELKKSKEWGVLDVMDHDVSELPENDETRLLVGQTRDKLEEMSNWDRTRFEKALSGVSREDESGAQGLRNGQDSGSGSEDGNEGEDEVEVDEDESDDIDQVNDGDEEMGGVEEDSDFDF